MAKYWMGVASVTILAGSALAGCSDAAVDIGEKNPQLAKSDLAAYAATWKGYVEAYQFEDKTDVVRLVLDEQGQGTLRFGERELFGPATSPTENYPPQSAWSNYSNETSFRPWSGFGYPVQNSRVESERIRFGAAKAELFSSYCALQTPYVDALSPSEPRYKCLPYSLTSSTIGGDPGSTACIIPATMTSSSYSIGDPTVEVNCEQLTMCGGWSVGCSCTATICSIDASYSDISVDAALDDAQQVLVGTLMIDNERLTVRLRRQ